MKKGMVIGIVRSGPFPPTSLAATRKWSSREIPDFESD